MLCYGYSREAKPMTDVCKSCNLCKVNITTFGDNEEVQCVALGQLQESCMRDNPDFRPMTKQEFLAKYHKIPIYQRKYIGLLDTYLIKKSRGAVE